MPEDDVEGLAGLGSKLHRKYRLYMQHVTIATPPADYAGRMVRIFPRAPCKRLRLFGLDATDIALSSWNVTLSGTERVFFGSRGRDRSTVRF